MNVQRWLILLFVLLVACNFPKLRSEHDLPTGIVMVTPIVVPPAIIPVAEDRDYHIGDMFPYRIQPGDTLTALAARFKTTPAAIANQNPFLAPIEQLTTLPPGQVLTIRLEREPVWEDPSKILPDLLFVNGPAQINADVTALIDSSNGWLKTYVDPSGENRVTGAQIVNSIVRNYSISPHLILAIMEYRLHALSDPTLPEDFSLGSRDPERVTLGSHLSWAANALNNGYYGWREGTLTQFPISGGGEIIPDPTDSAASVAIQYYFSLFSSNNEYLAAISSTGLAQTYEKYFGAINWNLVEEMLLIPGSLKQPPLRLPFQADLKWAFTGGPHSGWGRGDPLAGIDFAPPSEEAGCSPSDKWVTAVADGVIVRSEDGLIVQDLDGDGYSQTGWAILYLHVFSKSAPAEGAYIKTGEQIGHPSCEGGHASGRHVHIARLYNGEWIPSGGVIPFNLDGWVASYGEKEYQGSLSRGGQVVRSNPNGEYFSQIMADPHP